MKPFQQSPNVEPLSELSWKRVEHGIFEKLDAAPSYELGPTPTGRKPWVLGAGLVMAAAAVVLFFSLPAGDKAMPQQASVHNTVQRSHVVTQASASEVTVGDASIEVEPRSAIWIDNSDDAIEVTLERGGVRLKVAPREDRDPVRVHAGNVRVEVVGTEFGVFRSAETTQVVVYEGVVSVIADGKRSRVSAGQTWPAVKTKQEQTRRNKRRHAKKTKSDEQDQATETAPSQRELYENAAQLESSAPDAAIALYRQLARGQGSWAANALFAQARLEMSRGNEDESRVLLDRYVRKYPRGSNLQDAHELLGDESQ